MNMIKHNDELAPQTADYVASAAKALVGAVPFAGSLLVELAGTVIPNQRMDRMAQFARCLEDRLVRLEQDFVRSQLNDPGFTDLMEEGLNQAARAVSPERRAQIAELVSGSLGADEIAYAESKHLLRLLGELNDVEILRLDMYRHVAWGRGKEYREKHEGVLTPAVATSASSEGERVKAVLQKSYDQHLERLGLLEVPEPNTPHIVPHGYRLTALGGLLCERVGLTADLGAQR